jgi:nucleotide-binding universal stress UspA family protein
VTVNSECGGRRGAGWGARRIIIGTSGSPGSLQALRYAAGVARDSGATLIPVLAVPPPDLDHAAGHGLRARAFRYRGEPLSHPA